jgi:PAS domain S-box-containing protein
MNEPPIAEFAQALFEDSNDALLVIDIETARVTKANAEARRLIADQDPPSLTNVPLAQLVRTDKPEQLIRIEQALAQSECRRFSEGVSIGSPPVPIELTVRPCGQGSALIACRDLRPLRTWQNRAAAAETELGLLMGAIPAAVWCVERTSLNSSPFSEQAEGNWHFRFLSPSVERVTGWPVSFFLVGPQRFAEIVHPDDRDTMLSEGAAFLVSPNPILSMEMRVVGADGFVRWLRSDIQATRDDQGRAIRLDCVLTDINRPKMAELSLCESQRWLTRLLETSTNGVFILDLAGRITLTNRAAEQITAMPADALLDRDWNDLPWAPDSAELLPTAGAPFTSDLAFRTLRDGQLKLVRPDGRMVPLSLNAAPLRDDAGRIVGVVVTMTDLSLRRQAEDAVRRSEERYRRLFEKNLVGVCRYTLDGRFLEGNPAYARMFGYRSPDEMRDVPGASLHADPLERSLKLKQLLDTGFLTNIESRRRRKDGSEFWVLENVALVDEGGGRTIEATLADITERKRAEQVITREHALLWTLLNSIPDAIFFKDRDGMYLGCNPAFEERVGLHEGEIIGRTAAEIFPAAQAREIQAEDARVFASGTLLRLEKNLEYRGGARLEEVLLHPMLDETGAIVGLLGVGRDITERRQIEEQLRQSGKMEGIGRLAGGVAHDFNNLLTIILGNISLLRSILRDVDDAADLLADCEKAAQRASELTNQLLGFARRKPLTLQPLDLTRRVAETAQLLRRIIDPNIRIYTQPQPDPWLIDGDPSHVGQILMNLCLNARDALEPAGGRITVETANVVIDESQQRENVNARGGEYVRLSVADNGPGIIPEIRARMFEPFFTTKPLGKGTGLGLAVVFGIVQQHNGWIECHCEPGAGTRFDIYFPRSRESARAPVVTPDPPVVSRRGNETILLVDDEEMIRELGRAILERQGYRVLQADDGLTALNVYQQFAGEIDLIVLDLTMPNLSGRETFRRLRELDPNVGVLLSSGYSTDEFEPGELDGILGFVPKPYRIEELAAAVRAALDRINPGHKDGDGSTLRAEASLAGDFV